MGIDVQTGRVVFIDDVTELTPRKLFSYTDEGFVPVVRTVSSDVVSFAFASFKNVEGAYQVTAGGTTYSSTALDTNFAS